MTPQTTRKKKHDMLQAIRVLSYLVDFIDDGIDFSSEDGQDLLAEARAAKRLIAKEISTLLQPESSG